jgi:tetratricopeptide (TPR) repeat protein
LKGLGREQAIDDQLTTSVNAIRTGKAAGLKSLVRRLEGRKRFDEAVEMAELASQRGLQDAELLALWGDGLIGVGQFTEAIEKFDQALALQSGSEHWLVLKKYKTLMQSGRPAEAEAVVEEQSGVDPAFLSYIGDDLASSGRFEDAMKRYRQHIENEPGAVAPRRELGRMHLLMGDWEAAITRLNEANVRAGGLDYDSMLLAGKAHFLAGRRDKAAEIFEAAWDEKEAAVEPALWLVATRPKLRLVVKERLSTKGFQGRLGPILGLLLGEFDEHELEEERARRCLNMCDWDFFQGLWELQRGRREAASEAFNRALDECWVGAVEHIGARAALGRMADK